MNKYRVTDRTKSRVVEADNAFHAFKAVYGVWPFDVVTAEDVGYYHSAAEHRVISPFRRKMSRHQIDILFGWSGEGDSSETLTYVMVDRSGV